MNGRNTSDVHTCVAKFSISWDGTFCSKVNHKIVVKLNTGCVQNVVTGPALGLTQRILFFQEPVTLTPTWMRSMLTLPKFLMPPFHASTSLPPLIHIKAPS
jgi:hypothetical protein